MRINHIVEFYHFKRSCVCIEFTIECREFTRFKESFISDRYISLYEWNEIFCEIDCVLEDLMGSETTVSEFVTDLRNKVGDFFVGELRVSYAFEPKQSSIVNFKKLKFDYNLDWILKVNIANRNNTLPNAIPELQSKTENEEKRTNHKPKYKASSKSKLLIREELADCNDEYKPDAQYTNNVIYTPGPSSSKATTVPPEYSPKHMSSDVTIKQSYTPSKIDATELRSADNDTALSKPSYKHKRVNVHDGHDVNSNENNNFRALTSELFGSSDDETDSLDTATTALSTDPVLNSKKSKRMKLQDPKLLRENTWIESHHSSSIKAISKTPCADAKNISQRKKKSATPRPDTSNSNRLAKPSSAYPMETFNEKNMIRLANFIEKTDQLKLDKEDRRCELQGLKLLNCNHLSNAELKRLVVAYGSQIHNLYNGAKPHLENLTPVMLTTSNVLTENQLIFVMQEIENLRDVLERGSLEDVLSEKVLPSFILHTFASTYRLSHKQSVERILLQEEYNSLFHNESMI